MSEVQEIQHTGRPVPFDYDPATQVNSLLNGVQPLFARVGYSDIQTLEGRLLTLADASFSDIQQRKAFKNLIRQTIWRQWANDLDRGEESGAPLGMPVVDHNGSTY